VKPWIWGATAAVIGFALFIAWWRGQGPDDAKIGPPLARTSTTTAPHERPSTSSIAEHESPSGETEDPYAFTEIGGRVINSSTAVGLGDARVRVFRGDVQVAETKSNEEGTFTIPGLGPGRYRFEAEAEGFLKGRLHLTKLDVLEDDADITIELAPAGRLRGTVRDPDGRTVEGASVALRVRDRPWDGESWAMTKTNLKGRYTFDLVPLDHLDVVAHHDRFGFVEETLPERADLSATLDLKFGGRREIIGEVRGANGQLANALVWIAPPGPRKRGSLEHVVEYAVTTGRDGRYELFAHENAIGIVAWADGYRSQNRLVGRGDERIDFQLEPSVTVRLRVEDGAGLGVPDVWVSASEPDHAYSQGTTDAEGELVLTDLRPGEVVLRLKTGEGQERTENLRLREDGENETTVVLEGRGRVTGHLVSSATKTRITDMYLVLGRAGNTFSQRIRSPSGSFLFEGVPPGTWVLFVRSDGFIGRELEGIAVTTATIELGEIELEPLARVEGRVIPAPGTTFILGEAKSRGTGQSAGFLVEADGGFVAELRAGSYDVEFRDGVDRERASTHWHLRAGERLVGVEIQLREF
jgi:hypothetical protein